MNADAKARCCEMAGISSRTIDNAITGLLQAELLTRIKPSLYAVNDAPAA